MEHLAILLFLLIVLYPVIRLGWYVKDYYIIKIGEKFASAKAIEWKTQLKLIPYGFQVTCPHCRKEQWFRKEQLYIGWDNSKNNYRCKHCKVGKSPKRLWSDKGYQTNHPQFKPKTPGWRSIFEE